MFRKWKLRLLLLWVEHRAKKEKVWAIDYIILYRLSKLLDKKMMSEASRKTLIKIRVSSCYHTASETISFLKILATTAAIKGDMAGNLPDYPFKREPHFESYSLDTYFKNTEGFELPLVYVIDEVTKVLELINKELSSPELHTLRKQYYKRMAGPLYATVFSLMEALFQIALS